MSKKIGIVLTGTIKPNANFVAVTDVDERRLQYIHAVNYYRRFAHVWLLENSDYDFDSDEEFQKIKGLTVVKCPISKHYHKGKGYQEFEMLDYFFSMSDIPEIIIKVTGRYIIKPFDNVFADSLNMHKVRVLINLHKRHRYADTYLLTFNSLYYRQYLMNLYQNVDDEHGVNIEDVYFNFFSKHNKDCQLFSFEDEIIAVSGTTGVSYPKKKKRKIKSLLRKMFIFLGIKFIPW